MSAYIYYFVLVIKRFVPDGRWVQWFICCLTMDRTVGFVATLPMRSLFTIVVNRT